MRIFVSWSGSESREVAELLKDWLPHVVQRADLYVSSQDIEKGERWAASVSTNLSEIDFGIIVVTPANIDAPWVNFEAGALSKSVKARVVPLLCGMDRIDAASSPLRQFQYALSTKDDIGRLVLAVNDASDRPLEASRIESAFQKWWPDFEAAFGSVSFEQPVGGPKTHEDARLGKIEGGIEALMADMTRMRRDVLRAASRPSDLEPPLARWVSNMHEREISLEHARIDEMERLKDEQDVGAREALRRYQQRKELMRSHTEQETPRRGRPRRTESTE